MTRHWTPDELMELARGFQLSAILTAAAELDVFTLLADASKAAEQLADALTTDLRATRILLDALAAAELLVKDGQVYSPVPGTAEVLTAGAPQNMLAMVRHLGVCMRNWSQLAMVVKTGQRAHRQAGVRGVAGELASFIEAMNDVSRSAAPQLIEAIGPPAFRRLLDIGAGPATWTIEFLCQSGPDTRAIVYDLPDVIPIARRHVDAAGLAARVDFVGGSFETDRDLPGGADLVWVSAIIHMNSRDQNRDLFSKVHDALAPGGRILIRDVIMDENRTAPPGGALFAVNMLVNTPGGGTYTFDEIADDLVAAGFGPAEWVHQHEFMSSVVGATKP
jgi:SAM-dependent methyltransferase